MGVSVGVYIPNPFRAGSGSLLCPGREYLSMSSKNRRYGPAVAPIAYRRLNLMRMPFLILVRLASQHPNGDASTEIQRRLERGKR
jgi:hypothetical protein